MTQWGLDALFNPGKRHMDDEKRRLQSTREEVGDASGGRRIDLESGKVAISLGGRRTAPTASADPDAPGGPADVLDAALEVTEEPAVALESDADIAPDVVDPDDERTLHEPADGVVAEAPSAADSQPAPDTPSAPDAESAPAPRARSLSANAWARRG